MGSRNALWLKSIIMENQTSSEKQELIEEVVGFNFHKLWFTFKELTFRPGETVSNYCDVVRTKYVSPVTYFLLAYGINFFFAKASGMLDPLMKIGQPESGKTSSTGMLDGFMNGFKVGNPSITEAEFENQKILFASTFDFLSTKEGILLISFPIIILVQWFFFKKFRKVFLHHLYFVLYVPAQINLLTIPLMFPVFFSQVLYLPVSIAIAAMSVGIYLYAEYKFYPAITVGNIAARTIGQFVAGLISYLIWFCLVMYVAFVIIQNFFS